MIHSTAIIAPNTKIGENVTIGAFCIIHDFVEIGDNSTIDNYCEVGIPTPLAENKVLSIGEASKIRSYSCIYAGSSLGDNFVSGHYATIRENSVIGSNVQLGSRGDIQGDCEIGSYTKMHADVHIGKESKIGQYVWMFPEVLLTNDPMPPSETIEGVIIEDFVVLAAKVLILPGMKIGKDAVVAAGSVVKSNIPSGQLFSGNPAKFKCNANILRNKGNLTQKAYPWRCRFHRGYSEDDVKQWLREFTD
jgi:acetyltransferase-like isoleucine patch superfamily enzyme